VTLKSQGVIAKAGGFGTDTIANMERIVGATGLANLIDGQVAGPQATSFFVDLSSNFLAVENIPFLGTQSFTVENFRNVRGTQNSDTVIGSDVVNVFFGSTGGDFYDGLDGFDTIDYGALGTAVTLKSQGVIEKGALGTDQIFNMERIIGAAGQINLIDGFTGFAQPTSFEIDLGGGFLQVKNIPFLGDQEFFIKNFVNVRGTTNDDIITGSNIAGAEGNNTFFGTLGNDAYDGAGGTDVVDYAGLGAGITLKAQGVIEKAGGLGTDTIGNIDRIIGEAGQTNIIDGRIAGPQVTAFNLRLTAEKLIVTGIPGGDQTFLVENFTQVFGTANNDTLVGGTGNETLAGEAGNDLIRGGTGNDWLRGGEGQDTLDGGNGTDTLEGGNGDDAYTVNLPGDSIIEAAGGGIDSVRSTAANFTLASFVENLTLIETGNTRGTGNDLGNSIIGNTGNNQLNGLDGSDTLVGDLGNDTLTGGLGADTLNGGDGLDVFRYDAFAERGDRINGYVVADDVLQFKASGFGGGLVAGINVGATGRYAENLTGAATSAAGVGQFIFETDARRLWWDADGGGGSAGEVVVLIAGVPGLGAGEIVIIA